MRIGDVLVLSSRLQDRNKGVAYQVRGDGQRKGVNNTDPRLRRPCRFCRACGFNGVTDRPGAQRNVNVACPRAGDGQHQRCGIAKIAIELDGARALGQPAIQRVQFEVDIRELLFGVGYRVVQLHVDQREPGKAQRADTKV